MKFEPFIRPLGAAFFGAVYTWVALTIVGYLAASGLNPILQWLIDTGHEALFYIGLYTYEAIVNVLLAVPFAVVFVFIAGLNRWSSVILAVLAGLVLLYVVAYWPVEWSTIAWVAQDPGWWWGLSVRLFSLPIAFVAVRAIRSRWSGTPPASEAQGRAAA